MFFLQALLAGIMIAIGGMANLGVAGREVGALIFCTGLFSVLVFKLPLFTGRIGYCLCPTGDSPKRLAVMLAANIIGAALVGFAAPLMGVQAKDAAAMIESKMTLGVLPMLLRGIGCGMMMYVAVSSFRRLSAPERVVGTFLAVPAFILSGFEHSIADAFYMAAAISRGAVPGLRWLLLLAVIAAGNGLGSLFVYYIAPNEDCAKGEPHAKG